MIAKKYKSVRVPSKKVLDAIATGLEEVTAYFELEGFPTRETEQSAKKESDETFTSESESEEDYYDGDSSGGQTAFDREDIEVAIDIFTSQLVQEGIIKGASSDESMSFSEVFERFFGEDHEITKMAADFEERIEGYFDLVGYEDMDIASKLAFEIRNMVLKLLKGYS